MDRKGFSITNFVISLNNFSSAPCRTKYGLVEKGFGRTRICFTLSIMLWTFHQASLSAFPVMVYFLLQLFSSFKFNQSLRATVRSILDIWAVVQIQLKVNASSRLWFGKSVIRTVRQVMTRLVTTMVDWRWSFLHCRHACEWYSWWQSWLAAALSGPEFARWALKVSCLAGVNVHYVLVSSPEGRSSVEI